MNRPDTVRMALAWCGPSGNGIVRLAQDVAGAAVDRGFRGPVLPIPDPRRLVDLADRLPADVAIVHLHLSEWLFADSGSNMVDVVDELVSALHRGGIGLALTLHDLPQPADGASLFARRAEAYRRVATGVDAVAVCSLHEKALLKTVLKSDWDVAIEVVPLPIDMVGTVRSRPVRPLSSGHSEATTVGIFGFLYPGKGHLEVIEELRGTDRPITVVAAGRAADRHEELPAELSALAADAGVGFECTGHIADPLVAQLLADIDVPVAPQTKVSASASINSWIAAGRRPLVPTSPYALELEERMPGSIWVYGPGELRGCVEQAMDHPELTRLPPGFTPRPSTAEVADQCLAWLARSAVRVAR